MDKPWNRFTANPASDQRLGDKKIAASFGAEVEAYSSSLVERYSYLQSHNQLNPEKLAAGEFATDYSQVTAPHCHKPSVGVDYSHTLAASGGHAPYSWEVSGLPAGLALNDGVISGVPTAGGTFSVSVMVTDSDNRSQTAAMNLVVDNALKITTTSLPGGHPRSAAFDATRLRWRNPALPPGPLPACPQGSP